MSGETLYYTPPEPPNHAGWERVVHEINAGMRRMRVPGGWLYQVENVIEIRGPDCEYLGSRDGWHPPVFVPDGAP